MTPTEQRSSSSVRNAVVSGALLQLHLPVTTGPQLQASPLQPLASGFAGIRLAHTLPVVLEQFHCVPESLTQQP